MDDIAVEAGITKPIVYKHFGDRRGLAVALRDAAFGAPLGVPSDDAARDREVLRERVASFLPLVSDVDHLRRTIVAWATSYQMFVAANRNVYRFLRAEGVSTCGTITPTAAGIHSGWRWPRRCAKSSRAGSRSASPWCGRKRYAA